MFPKLVVLCGYELTLDQLEQMAKPYGPELGYDLSTTAANLIARAFQFAMTNPSFYQDENGVVKLLEVAEVRPPKKERKAAVKQRLIETDEEVQAAVLETIRDAGVFTEELPEHILDDRGSASWIFATNVEDDDILAKVARALEELERTGKIEMDVEEAGWRCVAEQ